MRRAIVTSFPDERTAVLMTPDLDFVRVRRDPAMAVGAAVDLDAMTPLRLRSAVPVVAGGGGRRRHPRLWRSAAGVAAACLLAVSALVAVQSSAAFAMPYAYVSVDINPSVEFVVSHHDRVLQVIALDAAGARLTERADYVGKPIVVAVDEYVAQAVKAGLAAPEPTVIVTAASAHRRDRAHMRQLTEVVAGGLSPLLRAQDGDMAALVVSQDVLKAALTYRVSPGRLALYVEAKLRGVRVAWPLIVKGKLAAAVGGAKELAKLMTDLHADKTLGDVLRKVAADAPARADVAKLLARAAVVVQPRSASLVSSRVAVDRGQSAGTDVHDVSQAAKRPSGPSVPAVAPGGPSTAHATPPAKPAPAPAVVPAAPKVPVPGPSAAPAPAKHKPPAQHKPPTGKGSGGAPPTGKGPGGAPPTGKGSGGAPPTGKGSGGTPPAGKGPGGTPPAGKVSGGAAPAGKGSGGAAPTGKGPGGAPPAGKGPGGAPPAGKGPGGAGHHGP